jgi:phospholipid-binding lipoprotein MlaA
MRWQALLLALVLLLQGCATVAQSDPRDPLESFNRGVFTFNDGLDNAVLKPVATAYRDVLPTWLRKGVSNFFNNLQDIWSAVNTGLQGRGLEMGDNIGRVMVNSTVGMLGVVDVASDLNIERHTADFGLTLGRWGVAPGPYLVVPLLGPMTLREVAALPVDRKGSVVNNVSEEGTRTGLTVLSVVDTRAAYLRFGVVVDDGVLDKYTFTRDAYLQRQRNAQYDGNPPEEPSAEP